MMGTYYIADSDHGDNMQTSWHATESDAIKAFWAENHLGQHDAERVNVYTREIVDPSREEWHGEEERAEETGLESICRDRNWRTNEPAGEYLSLTFYGRTTIAGQEWVRFHDGDSTSVVKAEDFDEPFTPLDQSTLYDDDEAEDYDDWCSCATFADDDTAEAVEARIK